MRRFARMPWLSALGLVVLAGCADNPLVLRGRLNQFEQQQLAMSRQHQQLQDRALALDRNNEEAETLLSRSRQQTKVLEDQVAALRDQLRGVTAQLAETREEKGSAENKVQALTASMRRRGGASITPNSSLLQTLPALDLPPGHVRRDGDVIRIALPAERLFHSGSTRLRADAATLIGQATSELLRIYPQQIIGIEGHTDSDPIASRQWRSNHQLSTARAMAVYDLLVGRTRLKAGQLFVVGHGPNHPIASNATLEGKRTNRRVELVVYPEKRG